MLLPFAWYYTSMCNIHVLEQLQQQLTIIRLPLLMCSLHLCCNQT